MPLEGSSGMHPPVSSELVLERLAITSVTGRLPLQGFIWNASAVSSKLVLERLAITSVACL